jgi:hypothetical protein
MDNAHTKRKLKRRHLILYLHVVDANSGELLGHLVDINDEGIMLMRNAPIEVGKIFQLKLTLPVGDDHEEKVVFNAKSLWCRPGPNKDIYDAGFQLEDASASVRATIRELIDDMGFDD